jgi:hypothetical protein
MSVVLRVTLTFLYGIAFTSSLRAQAAVEYTARSAASNTANAAARIHLGVCPLDSTLVTCVHRYYPATFYIALVGICFLLGKLLLIPKRSA